MSDLSTPPVANMKTVYPSPCTTAGLPSRAVSTEQQYAGSGDFMDRIGGADARAVGSASEGVTEAAAPRLLMRRCMRTCATGGRLVSSITRGRRDRAQHARTAAD